jgi:hypothetical protein
VPDLVNTMTCDLECQSDQQGLEFLNAFFARRGRKNALSNSEADQLGERFHFPGFFIRHLVISSRNLYQYKC